MYLIKTAKYPRLFEAIFELVAKLVGSYCVYILFNWFINTVLDKDVKDDTLLSLLLLPALYVLKDIYLVIDPMTVTVEMHRDKISVTRGFFPQIIDTLEFKNVENTEVITTLLGRLCDYSTIRLYSPGGLVEMPHVYAAKTILERINHYKKYPTPSNDAETQ